jgi:hypothetical protein
MTASALVCMFSISRLSLKVVVPQLIQIDCTRRADFCKRCLRDYSVDRQLQFSSHVHEQVIDVVGGIQAKLVWTRDEAPQPYA